MQRNVDQETDVLRSAIREILLRRRAQIDQQIEQAKKDKNPALVKRLREKRRSLSVSQLDIQFPTPKFGNLMNGRLSRRPSSEFFEHLDQTLQLSPEELEQIQNAGRATREPIYLPEGGFDPENLLIRLALAYMPLPTLIIDRTWRVLEANEPFWRFWNLPETTWNAIPTQDRNLLNLFFVDHLPFWPRLSTGLKEEWQRLAQYNVRAFKQHNEERHLRHYQNIIDRLIARSARFNELWQTVQRHTPISSHPRGAHPMGRSPVLSRQVGAKASPLVSFLLNTEMHTVKAHSPIHVDMVCLSEAIHDPFPALVVAMPHDEEACAWFHAIGLIRPSANWRECAMTEMNGPGFALFNATVHIARLRELPAAAAIKIEKQRLDPINSLNRSELHVPLEQHMERGTIETLLFDEQGNPTVELLLLLFQGRLDSLFDDQNWQGNEHSALELYDRIEEAIPAYAGLFDMQVDISQIERRALTRHDWNTGRQLGQSES